MLLQSLSMCMCMCVAELTPSYMPQAVKIEAACSIKESELHISRGILWTQKLKGEEK